MNVPRRLEPNDGCVEYLLKLDEQLVENGVDESDYDSKEILVNNVLDEVKTRVASAASDRRTSFILEKLVLITTLGQLIELFKRFPLYSIFLAKNRYSSHVLQTSISRLCYLLKTNSSQEFMESSAVCLIDFIKPIIDDYVEMSKDISGTHVLRSIICLLVGLPVISERRGKNSKHQHSVAHSVTLESLLLSSGQHIIDPCHFYDIPSGFYDLFRSIIQLLLETKSTIIHELLADTSSCAVLILTFRLLSSHTRLIDHSDLADKLLIHILELTYNSNIHTHIYNKNDTSIDTKLFYAMAGDKCASHFLETITECGNMTLLLPLFHAAFSGHIEEYVRDNVANFVIQSCMKRFSYELNEYIIYYMKRQEKLRKYNESLQHNKKKKKQKMDSLVDDSIDSTTLSDTAEHEMKERHMIQIYELSKNMIQECMQMSLFPDLVRHKGGIILWMIQLSTSLHHYQHICVAADNNNNNNSTIESITNSDLKESQQDNNEDNNDNTMDNKTDENVNWIQNICVALVNEWTGIHSGTASTAQIATYISNKLMATTISNDTTNEDTNTTNEVPETQSNRFKKPNKYEKYSAADPTKIILVKQLGAILSMKKPIHNNNNNNTQVSTVSLLHTPFYTNSTMLEKVIGAIASLPSDTIQYIAMSGQLSRPLLDPFIQYHAQSSHFGKFIKSFLSISTTLATHFVGQHIFKQVYDCIGIKDKERFIQQCLPYKESFILSKEGRNTMRFMDMDGYIHDASEWVRALKKQARAAELLYELDGNNNSHHSQTSSSPIGQSNYLSESITGTGTGTAINSGVEKREMTQTGMKKMKREPLHIASVVPVVTDTKQSTSDNNNDDELDNDDVEGHEEGPRKRKRKRTRKNNTNITSQVLEAHDSDNNNNNRVERVKFEGKSDTGHISQEKVKPPVNNSGSKNISKHAEFSSKSTDHHTKSYDKRPIVNNHDHSDLIPSSYNTSHPKHNRVNMDRIQALKGSKLLTSSQLKQETERLLQEKKAKKST